VELSHEYGRIGDLRMHWVAAGAGETVVLLLRQMSRSTADALTAEPAELVTAFLTGAAR
jgi:hypothetical protein